MYLAFHPHETIWLVLGYTLEEGFEQSIYVNSGSDCVIPLKNTLCLSLSQRVSGTVHSIRLHITCRIPASQAFHVLRSSSARELTKLQQAECALGIPKRL